MVHQLGIYPFSTEAVPLVRHSELLDQYRISALVSPKSWGYENQIFEVGAVRLLVSSSLEKTLPQMDTLFVPELQVSEIVEKQIINNICGAAPHLHMIHCVGKMKDQNLIQLKNACKKANCSLNILSSAKQSLEFYGIKREHSGVLQQISVPVVAVAGLWENTDKFEVTLSLREHLLKEGYRVSQVGSRPYCELFGFHSFPEFMFDSSIDERDKIF